MSIFTCGEVRELAPELALGVLSGAERAEAIMHVNECARCQALVLALLHWRRVVVGGERGGMMSRRSRPMSVVPCSAFAGFRFRPEIIVLALRWYLR